MRKQDIGLIIIIIIILIIIIIIIFIVIKNSLSWAILVSIVLPFLGYHSKHLTKQLRSCKNKFYGIFDVKIVFQNTRRIKSFFPYKDKLAPSFRSKVVYRANCWDCNDLRDRKTEHFKALTTNCPESEIADHVILTNHTIKWDHFEILASGRSDMHCKIKESLLIRDLKPALNENVCSERLHLYYKHILVVLCQEPIFFSREIVQLRFA